MLASGVEQAGVLGNGGRERRSPGPARIWLQFGTPHQLRQAERGGQTFCATV